MRDKSFLRTSILLVFLFMGLIIGILIVPSMGENGMGYGIAAAGLMLITISIIAVRIFIVRQRKVLKSEGDSGKTSEVGFVVDTFQDLVGKLKEKEKELERLRAFAEEKADSMEAYNANILQSVPSGVVSVDNSLKIKSINQSAERILGVQAKDITDRSFHEVFGPPLTSLTSNDRKVLRGEYPYVTNDNRHIWLGITSSELKNAAADKIGLIFVFTDLTDIKALQAQVELKHRLSQLGEMSAGISHELRNSMSVIAGYAKLLARKVEPDAQPTVDSISSEITNMDKIISELLAFAKPSVLSREKVDLSSLLKETLRSAVADRDSIKSLVRVEDSVTVEADEVLLRQALTNLFNNAAEAMPEGGSIEVELNRLYSKAGISIKDTGSGIPENIIQKIFLPFYTTKEKGIGFGLALVQKIIVSHGGSIEVESKEGEGATFRIALPLMEQ